MLQNEHNNLLVQKNQEQNFLRVTQKTTWICKTSMKFILKFYNFLEQTWLDDLKSSSNFTKFWAIAPAGFLLKKSDEIMKLIKKLTHKWEI